MLLMSFFAVQAQTVDFHPRMPEWGDTLSIDFKADSINTESSNFFFLIFLNYEKGTTRKISLKAKPASGSYSAFLVLPDSVSFLKLFVTNNEMKIVDSTYKSLIYNHQRHVARNGYAQLAVFYDDAERERYFNKELELYPDNYPEYQNYWSTEKLIHALDNYSLKDTVSAMLAQISNANPRKTPGLYYLFAHANLILGNREKYLIYLNGLARNYPTSPITKKYINLFKVFEDHNKYVAQAGRVDLKKENGQLAYNFYDIFLSWQNTILNDHYSSSVGFAIAAKRIDDKNIPAGHLKDIFLEQVARDENDPKPFYYLAKLYSSRFKDYNRALAYIGLAESKFKAANKPFYFTPYSTRYQKGFFQKIKSLKSYLLGSR